MERKTSYSNLSVFGNKFVANHTATGEKLDKLKSGAYTIHYDAQHNVFWFEDFKAVSDDILDLPSQEYKQITTEMNHFLKDDVRAKFKAMGYIYKRSALLYGLPGTGKTCIVNRISKDVINRGGVVLYTESPQLLKMAFEVLTDIQPETLTLAVFEEFDSISKKYEDDLLTLLDGEVQKENVMYLATTNYIDKVPKRLYRPGRFSSVIEVNYPNIEARRLYLNHKLGNDFINLQLYLEKSEGLSIDELKEIIQSVEILNGDLDVTIERLKATKDLEEKPKTKNKRPGLASLFGEIDGDDYDDNY